MGKVYVVGLGPGGEQYLTAEARTALDAAEVLCGYTVYVDLVAPLYPGKETYTTPMKQELDRCRWALETANRGRTVAMVCSGDAGVYGMAGPVLELAPAYPTVEVRVVPGVSALLSGAAVLGAPLGHDFCVISLSDLLTPWAKIEQRLKAAAEADFVIVLYNPVSRTRLAQYQRACAILSETLPEDRVCAYVRNIGRDGQKSRIFLLNELAGLASGGTAAVTVGECGDAVENANVGGGCASAKDATADSAAEVQPEIDMLSTIFVGNSETRVIETPDGPRMVTPRGYERKRVLDA